MKAATIENKIRLYDIKKGYFRLLMDESHIKELREFCNSKLKGVVTLSPSLLLDLAAILLAKKDREGDSESSQIFRKLVGCFGGYEALDTLKEQEQLSAENVAFLEKNRKQAERLAPLLVSLGKSLPLSKYAIVLKAAEMMLDRQRLVDVFKDFERFASKPYAVFYFETLSMLNRYGMHTDEMVPLLSEVKQLYSIKQLLEGLYKLNPHLFHRDNVITILRLQNPYYFHKLLELLPATQESLNVLFAVDGVLDQCSQAQEIIKNFKSAGWELQPYLKYILSGDRNGLDLVLATGRLKEMAIPPELLPLILEAIFTRSNESIALVNAVALLNKENLEERVLTTAFSTKYPDRVAAAIVELKKENHFNKQTSNVICSHPEYAIELAQAMIQLHHINCTTLSAAYDGIEKSPQSADKAARVIEYLQKNSLVHHSNDKPDAHTRVAKQTSDAIIVAVCKAELTDDSLLKLLEIMKAAGLLDLSNLHKLTPRLAYVKTLTSAAKCLANGDKLDELNFDSIISDPINAIALAENLGGIPSSPSSPKRVDGGAKDFAEIRKAAKILAQGQQQGLFFAKLEPEKIATFERATHREMAAIQNEAMMKIAQYTSEYHLEKNTEQHLANSAYFSVLKP